jgi:Fic family protein
MSAQICTERKYYYKILETTQKGSLDITKWLDWFISCLERATENSKVILKSVLQKEKFWDQHKNLKMNDRQIKVIHRLFDGLEGKLISTKWAVLTKCSQDTASRHIDYLLKNKIFKKDIGGGRSTSYFLVL